MSSVYAGSLHVQSCRAEAIAGAMGKFLKRTAKLSVRCVSEGGLDVRFLLDYFFH